MQFSSDFFHVIFDDTITLPMDSSSSESSEFARKKLLENYFKPEKRRIVGNQIRTFNHFLNHDIQNIINNEPTFTVNFPTETYTVTFRKVYIPEKVGLEENMAANSQTPQFFIKTDGTYDIPVYVDIIERYTPHAEGGKIDEIHHSRVEIARVPVMVMSDRCNLYDISEKSRIEQQMCPFDHGGYFIIRGKERVLIGQMRNVHNKVIVTHRSSISKFSTIAEIRSMSDETGHSVLFQVCSSLDKRVVTVNIPCIKDTIPVGILFKAMGAKHEDIEKYIGIEKTSPCYRYVRGILFNCNCILTEEEALAYIGRIPIRVIHDPSRVVEYARQIVNIEMFPHFGITYPMRDKMYFLGNMTRKLILTNAGIRPEDDRDNYTNKRVEMAGVLCNDLFRTLYKRLKKTIAMQIEKKKQRYDIRSIFNKTNLISSGLKHSFSTGNWGAQRNNYMRSGVSQVRNVMSYGAALSHARRIMIPVVKEGKNSQIRKINTSSIFFICPCETPEGMGVGIVLNLSLLADVTNSVSTVLVRNAIEVNPRLIRISSFRENNDLTSVYVNGYLIGFVREVSEFVSDIRALFVSPKTLNVSVNYIPHDNEILVYSDEGRLMRPVIAVRDGVPLYDGRDGYDWDRAVESGEVVYIDNSDAEQSVIAMTPGDIVAGKRTEYLEIHPAMMLGVVASTIPFPEHTPSPRNCYQASMGKQALGVFSLAANHRLDTNFYMMNYPQKSLMTTDAANYLGFGTMMSGANAIVAVMTYTGYNQEDSIILNKASIDRGMFSLYHYKTLSYEKKKMSSNFSEENHIPSPEIRIQYANYGFLDEYGLVRVGSRVDRGDVVIAKSHLNITTNVRTDSSIILKHGEGGIVDRVVCTTGNSGYKIFKIVLRNLKIPEIGDKFATRAAQKGTVGMIYRQEDMPFTSDGITPDIIINPHAFPSRMTINQLFESIGAKACVLSGKMGDASPFRDDKEIEGYGRELSKFGYSHRGTETMYNGMTGERLLSSIFIGPVYYQRLKHMVADKIHARDLGPVTTLTRQPLEGRSRDGGLRYGEMERDATLAHGSAKFLKERLFEESDFFQVPICDKCGAFASRTTLCTSCNSKEVFLCNLPYAAKLLFQELTAMGIKIKTVIK